MIPAEAPGKTDYRGLAKRLGPELLRRRIEGQAGLWASEVHQGSGFFKIEKFLPVDKVVTQVLRFTGLRKWGLKNYLDVQIVHNEVRISGLPTAFDGFRLLQLADLHCDLEPALIDVVIQHLGGLEYDAAVFTGDYHNKIAANHDVSLALMERLLPHVRTPRFGIMGNHDFIEKVVFFEEIGLPVLLNEGAAIERKGERIWICGVDDPHFFRTEDLAKARASVAAGETAILLSHSPEPYEEAARLGYQLLLCGHTHGGQLCLPGGIPVVRNNRAPHRLIVGAWREGEMQGYTSRGTGGCGVAARFFCPPEMTVHVLRRA